MSLNKVRIASTFLISSFLSLTGGNAWATDIEPVLDASSGQLSSASLYRGDTLSFSFRVTDDVACCSWVGWGIYSEPGQNVDSGNLFWTANYSPSSFRVNGNEQDGSYRFSLLIPNGIAFGTYYLKVQAIDNAGSYTHLDQIGTFTVSDRPSNSDTSTSQSTTGPNNSSPTPKPTVSTTPSVSPTPSPSESMERSPGQLKPRSNDQNSIASPAQTDSAGVLIGIAGFVILGAALGISYAYLRQKQGKPLFPRANKQGEPLLPAAQKQEIASKPKPSRGKR